MSSVSSGGSKTDGQSRTTWKGRSGQEKLLPVDKGHNLGPRHIQGHSQLMHKDRQYVSLPNPWTPSIIRTRGTSFLIGFLMVQEQS